jgi:hypothetical protein
MGGSCPCIPKSLPRAGEAAYISYGREGQGIFAENSHQLITARYSSITNNANKLVFTHFFLVGHSTTRELLQRHRTEAHAAIRKRLGVSLSYTDNLGDTVTVTDIRIVYVFVLSYTSYFHIVEVKYG